VRFTEDMWMGGKIIFESNMDYIVNRQHSLGCCHGRVSYSVRDARGGVALKKSGVAVRESGVNSVRS